MVNTNTKERPASPRAIPVSDKHFSDAQLERLARQVADMSRCELAQSASTGAGVNMLIYTYAIDGLRRMRLVEENIARQYGPDWASNKDAKNALGEHMRFLAAAFAGNWARAIILAAIGDKTDLNTGSISEGILVLAQTPERVCVYMQGNADPPWVDVFDQEDLRQSALKVYGVDPTDAIVWFHRPLTATEEAQMMQRHVEIPNRPTANRIFVSKDADFEQLHSYLANLGKVAGRLCNPVSRQKE